MKRNHFSWSFHINDQCSMSNTSRLTMSLHELDMQHAERAGKQTGRVHNCRIGFFLFVLWMSCMYSKRCTGFQSVFVSYFSFLFISKRINLQSLPSLSQLTWIIVKRMKEPKNHQDLLVSNYYFRVRLFQWPDCNFHFRSSFRSLWRV